MAMSAMEKLSLRLGFDEEISILSGNIENNSQFLAEYKKLRSEADKKRYQTKLLKMAEESLALQFDEFELVRQTSENFRQQLEHVIETVKRFRQKLTNLLVKYDEYLEETRVKKDDESEILEDTCTRGLKAFNLGIVRGIEMYEHCFTEFPELREFCFAAIKRLHIRESRAELKLWSLEDLMKEIFPKPSENEVD